MKQIRKRKTNAIFFHLYVEFKNQKQKKYKDHRLTNMKNKYVVAIVEKGGGGKIGE